MGKIDDAIRTIEGMGNGTERAMQLAGLISTLFRIKGVALVVTGRLAYEGYANGGSDEATLDLGALGPLPPRVVLEVMRGQLPGEGTLHHWVVAGVPVRLGENPTIVHRELCRDFSTDLGVVKLAPVEEITANLILAAVHPHPDAEAHQRAHLLLMNALIDAFPMNWAALHALCHRPDYRVGDELAQMRLAAKRDADAAGMSRDHIGEVAHPSEINDAVEPALEPAMALETAETLAMADASVSMDEAAVSTLSPEAPTSSGKEEVVDLSRIDPNLLLGDLRK